MYTIKVRTEHLKVFIKMLTDNDSLGDMNGSPISERPLHITLDEISISFLSLGPRIPKIRNSQGVSNIFVFLLSKPQRCQRLELGTPTSPSTCMPAGTQSRLLRPTRERPWRRNCWGGARARAEVIEGGANLDPPPTNASSSSGLSS